MRNRRWYLRLFKHILARFLIEQKMALRAGFLQIRVDFPKNLLLERWSNLWGESCLVYVAHLLCIRRYISANGRRDFGSVPTPIFQSHFWQKLFRYLALGSAIRNNLIFSDAINKISIWPVARGERGEWGSKRKRIDEVAFIETTTQTTCPSEYTRVQ